MSKSRRVYVSLAVFLAILLAACGGDGGTVDTSEPDDSAGATEPAADSTTSTSADDGSDSPRSNDVPSGETSAVLDLGGETYMFGMGPGASCDPARQGFLYEAQLLRVDANGDPVGNDGLTLVFDGEGRGTTVSVVVDEVNWTAGEGTGGGSPSDSYSIDGAAAVATLAFVSSAGEETEGSIEVFCAEG